MQDTLGATEMKVDLSLDDCDIDAVCDLALKEKLLLTLEPVLAQLAAEGDAGWTRLLSHAERFKQGHCAKHVRRQKRTVALIRGAFSNAQVPFVFLRGLPFAAHYYPPGVTRFSEDIDLLVTGDDVESVCGIMSSLGYIPNEGVRRASSRARYMGQCEMRHQGGLSPVDLNWRMTGNCGVGPLDTDLEVLWGRTVPVSGSERRLSDEDMLLDILRHAVHGHDFVQGILRTCVDMDAITAASSQLDWGYIRSQIREQELVRGACFVGFFYCSIYQSRYSDTLSRIIPFPMRGRLLFESRLFTRLVISPSVRKGRGTGRIHDYMRLLLGMMAKAWATDRLSRLLRILRVPTLPSRDELVLLGGIKDEDSGPIREQVVPRLCSLSILPGLMIGVALRIALGFCGDWGRREPCQ